MIAPLTSGRCQLNGLGILSAVALAILMSVAPHQASAKGGIKSCCFISRAEAAPITSPRSQPTTETLGVGCGGPIGVAALPILAIKSPGGCDEYREAAGLIGPIAARAYCCTDLVILRRSVFHRFTVVRYSKTCRCNHAMVRTAFVTVQ